MGIEFNRIASAIPLASGEANESEGKYQTDSRCDMKGSVLMNKTLRSRWERHMIFMQSAHREISSRLVLGIFQDFWAGRIVS
jgi:hypothetical protein